MDNDCLKDKKCCSNGCYKICVSPTEESGAAAGILLTAGIIPSDWLWPCILYMYQSRNEILRIYDSFLKNVERSKENFLLDCQELLKVPDGIIPNAVCWPRKIIVWMYSFVKISFFCPDGLTILLLSVLGIWFYTESTIVEYSRISILRPLLGKCQEATVILFSKFLPLSSKYTWTERPLPHLSVVLFLSQKQTPVRYLGSCSRVSHSEPPVKWTPGNFLFDI